VQVSLSLLGVSSSHGYFIILKVKGDTLHRLRVAL
jgi:hypothetical protein